MNILDELKEELAEIKRMLREKNEPEEILTTSQVCKLLNMHRHTVYELRDKGILKVYGAGKMERYKRSEVIGALVRLNSAA